MALGTLVTTLVAAMGLMACEGPPSADSLKDWTPADHRSADDDKGVPAANRGPAMKGNEIPQLVDMAWRQQCTPCHGQLGRGDGPTGPMLRASDLSNADWQAKTSDQEIGATIKNGRNKMPKFNLPDEVVAGLVGHIRQLKAP